MKYSCLIKGKHKLHITEISPKEYSAHIVKAHNSFKAQESLHSIAHRLQATLAINGGFYEYENNEAGLSSGTLIINNVIYNLKCNEKHSVLCIDHETEHISIRYIYPHISLLERERERERERDFLSLTSIALCIKMLIPLLLPVFSHAQLRTILMLTAF